jgi:anion-transporting  ArsA/GET3 family ATPase
VHPPHTLALSWSSENLVLVTLDDRHHLDSLVVIEVQSSPEEFVGDPNLSVARTK